jgi:hypothetical protein
MDAVTIAVTATGICYAASVRARDAEALLAEAGDYAVQPVMVDAQGAAAAALLASAGLLLLFYWFDAIAWLLLLRSARARVRGWRARPTMLTRCAHSHPSTLLTATGGLVLLALPWLRQPLGKRAATAAFLIAVVVCVREPEPAPPPSRPRPEPVSPH